MTTKENIKIKDDKCLSYLPKIIQNLFLHTYNCQGFIYIKEVRGKEYASIEPTDVVKWLNEITVETTSLKKAYEIMHEYFNTNYPQYKERIYLF